MLAEQGQNTSSCIRPQNKQIARGPLPFYAGFISSTSVLLEPLFFFTVPLCSLVACRSVSNCPLWSKNQDQILVLYKVRLCPKTIWMWLLCFLCTWVVEKKEGSRAFYRCRYHEKERAFPHPQNWLKSTMESREDHVSPCSILTCSEEGSDR